METSSPKLDRPAVKAAVDAAMLSAAIEGAYPATIRESRRERIASKTTDTILGLSEAAPADLFDADPNDQRSRGKRLRLTFGSWRYRWATEATVFGNCAGFDNLDVAISQVADRLEEVEWGCRVVMVDAAGDQLLCDTEDADVEQWLTEHLISAEIIGFVDRPAKSGEIV